jgi:endogenous inhibitor of DNA gyrase (YacG/DUF329 family)
METKDLDSTRCASCDGTGIPEILRPYCSVVCRAIGASGLGWRTNPYRIVDVKSETQLSSGPSFDVTTKGVAELKKKIEYLQEKARMNLSAVWIRPERISQTPITTTNMGVEANV